MKALRKKFILFAMTAVTFLLVILLCAIACAVWFVTDRQTDMIVDTLLHADGVFGHMDFDERPPFKQPLDMDRMKATRFFTVFVDDEGAIVRVNVEQIAAVNTEKAIQYAENVLGKEKNAGEVDGYKFAVKESPSGKLVLFVDTSEQRATLFSVIIASCVIVAVCWFLVFIFVVLLSEKVVRPVWQGMEKQKQFITNAGHELKTPLAVIQANNDAMVLIHGENKYNVNIRTQTERLTALTNTMLSLAKFEELAQQPRVRVNTQQLLQQVVRDFRDAAEEKRITVQFKTEDAAPFDINEEAFVRLLTLLTDNAVKYTPEGGNICFSLFIKNRNLWVIEENTCDTRRIEDAERLFDRFYRVDTARTQTSEGGYGIGLSAARTICESFNGTLRAEIVNENCIRFTAILPGEK